MKPKFNSAKVHPQLGAYGHPVDGALVGAGSLWSCIGRKEEGGRE